MPICCHPLLINQETFTIIIQLQTFPSNSNTAWISGMVKWFQLKNIMNQGASQCQKTSNRHFDCSCREGKVQEVLAKVEK